MFNKLLSNLPFNPSLINQVSFYAKRLHQETALRRLGFTLVVLTMIVQLFAVFAPAQPSLALMGNDLLSGGFASKDQAVQACNTNQEGYNTILGHFGISCANLANAGVVTLRSTDAGNQLYSMGRIPQGPENLGTHKITNEVPVVVGSTTFYMRLLSSWDSGASSTYTALSIGNTFGVHYYVLFSCGNIVQIGKPAPPPPPAPPPKPPTPPPVTPPPKPIPLPCKQARNVNDTQACLVPGKKAQNVTQHITDANGTTAKAGDTILYTLFLKNGGTVAVTKYTIQENISDVLEYADITNYGGSTKDSKNILTWPALTISPGETVQKQLTVKVKDPVPSTPSPCANSTVKPCPTSNSFDLIMTNVYGNTINIRVQPPIGKTVETVTTTTLPNTGPGTSVIIGAVVTTVVGYFFARSRLLAKEVDIVRSEYTSGGM